MQKASRITVFLLVAIILSLIVLLRPYWGLMDDHFHVLHTLPDMKKSGFFSYLSQYIKADIAWGMFRVTYPLMVEVVYLPSVWLGPWMAYMVAAILSFGALYWNALVFEKIFAQSKFFFCVGIGCFFYGYDLIQHPSLQEKMILLSGAGSLFFALKENRWERMAGVFFFSMLGVLSKASFCIYLSMVWWILAWNGKEKSWKHRLTELAFFSVFLLSSVLFLGWVSKQGGYTTGNYSLGKIIPNVFSRDGILLFLPFLAGLFLETISFFRHKNPLVFTPYVGIAAFFVIFLPWGIQAYIQANVAPLYGVLLVRIGYLIFSGKFFRIWMPMLIALSVLVCSYRTYFMLRRMADLRIIIQSAHEIFDQRGVQQVFMPCLEGVDAVRRYIENFSASKVQVIQQNDVGAGARNTAVWLYDNAICPLPGRALHIPGCEEELLYNGTFKKSFKVVRLYDCDHH